MCANVSAEWHGHQYEPFTFPHLSAPCCACKPPMCLERHILRFVVPIAGNTQVNVTLHHWITPELYQLHRCPFLHSHACQHAWVFFQSPGGMPIGLLGKDQSCLAFTLLCDTVLFPPKYPADKKGGGWVSFHTWKKKPRKQQNLPTWVVILIRGMGYQGYLSKNGMVAPHLSLLLAESPQIMTKAYSCPHFEKFSHPLQCFGRWPPITNAPIPFQGSGAEIPRNPPNHPLDCGG